MRKLLVFMVAGLTLVLAAYFWWRTGTVPRSEEKIPRAEMTSNQPAAASQGEAWSPSIGNTNHSRALPTEKLASEKLSPVPRYVAPRIPEMPELTNLSPPIVMENLRSTFRQYANRFGGNPVGTNPEITAALRGENPKQAQFLNSEDGLRVNENGELVDNWGTPFFFHQLSAREMEIHSAGPDRILWTADDLVIK